VPELLRADDVVLIKGSHAVGLELVCRAVCAEAEARV
jgi:UDP-N-acetylmuramyl pentapeptide synthase